MEKENITVDLASSLAGNTSRKKSRSKSIGPGGLDVLKSGSGNRRVVCYWDTTSLPTRLVLIVIHAVVGRALQAAT